MLNFLDSTFIASLPTSRADALKLGAKYYAGRPCLRFGHVVRFAFDWSCCECHRIDDRIRQKTDHRKSYSARRRLRQDVRDYHTAQENARIQQRIQLDPIFRANVASKRLIGKACRRIRAGHFNPDYVIIEPRVPQEHWFNQIELHNHFLPHFYAGCTWRNYGDFRTGGYWGVDHWIPRGIIMEGTPQEVINRVLCLDNLRPIKHTENALKIPHDKQLIANFRDLLAVNASLDQLLAILPPMPAMR